MSATIRACIVVGCVAISCRAGEDADEGGTSAATLGESGSTGSAPGSEEDADATSEGASSSATASDEEGSASTGSDPPPCEMPDVGAQGFHAAPDGTPDGDGSMDAPWDLGTAFAHPPEVTAGATIWVHGGTYAAPFVSTLTGAADAPIIVRAAPGERATIDGAGVAYGEPNWLRIEGAHTWLWGVEIASSETDPDVEVAEAISVSGTGIKLVNLVVHDVFNNGFFQSAVDLEIHGSLFYNVGYNAPSLGLGGGQYGYPLYVQNLEGTKLIEDNIVMNNFSFGLHAYTEGGYLERITLSGNVWFNNGAASPGEDKKDDILLGPVNNAAREISVRDNAIWARAPDLRAVRFGYGAPNEDIELVGNYVVGETLFSDPWSSVMMTDNTFYAAPSGQIDPASHPDNAYLDAPPSENVIRVRPNRYEPGRAHVVVYNWLDADAVAVDLGDVLEVGTAFEIRNAQTFWDPPAVAGVFDGSPVELPMGEVVPTPSPVAPADLLPSERTGRAFHAFVVLPTPCPRE
jgi:hypothetical protein